MRERAANTCARLLSEQTWAGFIDMLMYKNGSAYRVFLSAKAVSRPRKLSLSMPQWQHTIMGPNPPILLRVRATVLDAPSLHKLQARTSSQAETISGQDQARRGHDYAQRKGKKEGRSRLK